MAVFPISLSSFGCPADYNSVISTSLVYSVFFQLLSWSCNVFWLLLFQRLVSDLSRIGSFHPCSRDKIVSFGSTVGVSYATRLRTDRETKRASSSSDFRLVYILTANSVLLGATYKRSELGVSGRLVSMSIVPITIWEPSFTLHLFILLKRMYLSLCRDTLYS